MDSALLIRELASPPLPGLPRNVGHSGPEELTTALISLKIPRPLAAWAGRASASSLTKRTPHWGAWAPEPPRVQHAPAGELLSAPPGGPLPPHEDRTCPKAVHSHFLCPAPWSEVGKGPRPGRKERPRIEPGPSPVREPGTRVWGAVQGQAGQTAGCLSRCLMGCWGVGRLLLHVEASPKHRGGGFRGVGGSAIRMGRRWPNRPVSLEVAWQRQ